MLISNDLKDDIDYLIFAFADSRYDISGDRGDQAEKVEEKKQNTDTFKEGDVIMAKEKHWDKSYKAVITNAGLDNGKIIL